MGRSPFREVFWTTETNEQLVRWLEARRKIRAKDPNALFLCVSGPEAGARLSQKSVADVLRRYCNKGGIPYMNPDSFRHRVGHAIIERDDSAVDVMNILGHASLASSSVYTMITDGELEERYRKIIGA